MAAGLITLAMLPQWSHPAGASTVTRITLFSQQQVQTIAFEMAQNLRYFKQEGLDVTIEYFGLRHNGVPGLQDGAGRYCVQRGCPGDQLLGANRPRLPRHRSRGARTEWVPACGEIKHPDSPGTSRQSPGYPDRVDGLVMIALSW